MNTPGSTTTFRTNTRDVPDVDASIEEMIDAGIVVCIAAGNRSHKIDINGGPDYDNYVVTDAATVYYHRGSSPYSEDAFIVGSIDSVDGGGNVILTGSNVEMLATYTERGPGVDLYAPGTRIISACSTTNIHPNDEQYFFNTSFRQMNISGTSMAAPQVAGVAALVAQIYKNIPSGSFPSFVKNFIFNSATASIHTTSADDGARYDDDYTNFRSPQTTGSVRLLYNPFGKETPAQIGNLSFNGVNLEFRK